VKKKIIFSFIFILIVNITNVYAYTDEEINNICEGTANCCESGYNVMCHMVDPIRNYNVSDIVCSNRGGGVYHKGIDLTQGNGDGTIYAIFDGVVIATTNNTKNCTPSGNLVCSPITCSSSRGVSVTIEVTDPRFAGYQVHYMHMSSKTVNVGDVVTQGKVLGKIGNTGCSTGKHLHFQVNNYAGDPINLNAYFVDKTLYACGGVTDSTQYEEFLNVSEIGNLLTNQNGGKYNAFINNCVGTVGQKFNQGIELYAKNITDIVNVNAIQSGYYIDYASDECINGVGILSLNGEIHLYCNLETKPNYIIGQKILASTNLGRMGIINNNKKIDFVVIRNGKYVDLSLEFLSVYGGSCKNNNRTSCSGVKTVLEKIQCQMAF